MVLDGDSIFMCINILGTLLLFMKKFGNKPFTVYI